jgi:hypothetical protein
MSRRHTSNTPRVFINRVLFLLIPVCLLWLLAGVAADTKEQKKMKPEEVMEAEKRLSGLGYWTGPVDGNFDGATRHALVAFQKIEGRNRTGILTPAELIALRSARTPAPRETGFAHVEIDLHRQVLFMVDSSGAVSRIVPISSGNGELFTSEGWTRRAVTPTGRFTVQRKIAGWRKSPLGLLYYPNYILSGVAIHGNPFVPVRPASHGCIRIPMFAAKEFSEMTPIGTVVLVYDQPSGDRPDVPLGRE